MSLGSTAASMTAKSRSSRPATSGNKNVSNQAKRSDQTARVMPIIKQNLKGPFK